VTFWSLLLPEASRCLLLILLTQPGGEVPSGVTALIFGRLKPELICARYRGGCEPKVVHKQGRRKATAPGWMTWAASLRVRQGFALWCVYDCTGWSARTAVRADHRHLSPGERWQWRAGLSCLRVRGDGAGML